MTTKKKSSELTRRDLLRRSAVGGATLAGVSTGAVRLDNGPVQESQAIAPAVAAAGVGGSIAAGWALREYEVIGADDPPEGLTPEALHNEIYNLAQSRESTDNSTFVDNANILESFDHTLFSDGKIEAIDALNEQKPQSEVEDDAIQEIKYRGTVVLKNAIKSWNETAQFARTNIERANDHDDLDDAHPDVYRWHSYDHHRGDSYLNWDEREYTLPNDETITIEVIEAAEREGDESYERIAEWDCITTHDTNGGFTPQINFRYSERDQIKLLSADGWQAVTNSILDAIDHVTDNIILWIDNVYGEIQDGELDTADLLTPREQAELTAEDEDFPQAIADLQALNVGVDLEREAEIYLPDIEATLYGQLAYTGDETLEIGEINPDQTTEDEDGNEQEVYPGSIYFNYDVSQGQGTWSAYDDGIDGGVLTLTSEPFEETIYYVDTAAGETAEFVTDDLTENDDGDEWTVDLSDQLDDRITSVEQIEYYAAVDSTQYETIQLQETFEIKRFTDSDGNEYDTTDFERSEPHTDDNYITEEEWQEQQERHEELIEKYENAQGSGIGFDNLGFGGIPGEGVLLAILAVIAALLGSSS